MGLYMFDLDGTLIRSFLREGDREHDYDDVEVLPQRRARLSMLAELGVSFAIVTNQAGIAMGYQTVDQMWRKMGLVVSEFEGFYGRPFSFHVCAHHPKARLEEWRQDPCPRRKPAPGMLEEAIMRHRVAVARAVFIGDMDSDRAAAEAAGVDYVDAGDYFDG